MLFSLSKAQRGKPTPASIGMAVSIVSSVGSAFIGWLSTINFIGHNTKDILSGITGLIILIANIVKPYFAVDVGAKTIPTDQVTEVEENSIKK